MLKCPKCLEPVREIYESISDQNHKEVQGYRCLEHGEVEPVEDKKECSICGFSDNQEDMVRNEGQYEHQECINDYLYGEARRAGII